jgi:AcrR family transcriptional regulator
MKATRLEGPALLAHPLSDALISAVRSRGYREAPLEEILERAALARREFEREFEGKDDLALRVFDALAGDFRARVEDAFSSQPRWPAQLRAAGWEMARWVLDNPESVWFGMVGVLDAGDMVLARRRELFLWCASLVDAGRAAAPDPDRVPPQASLVATGAVVELLRRGAEGPPLHGVVASVPFLLYGAVRPYLGEEAARAELEIDPPPDLACRRSS